MRGQHFIQNGRRDAPVGSDRRQHIRQIAKTVPCDGRQNQLKNVDFIGIPDDQKMKKRCFGKILREIGCFFVMEFHGAGNCRPVFGAQRFSKPFFFQRGESQPPVIDRVDIMKRAETGVLRKASDVVQQTALPGQKDFFLRLREPSGDGSGVFGYAQTVRAFEFQGERQFAFFITIAMHELFKPDGRR